VDGVSAGGLVVGQGVARWGGLNVSLMPQSRRSPKLSVMHSTKKFRLEWNRLNLSDVVHNDIKEKPRVTVLNYQPSGLIGLRLERAAKAKR